MPASISSIEVRGAMYSVPLGAPAPSGSGRALRSTLPFCVSGSSSSRTNAEGIM
jgi:hypothetical protein